MPTRSFILAPDRQASSWQGARAPHSPPDVAADRARFWSDSASSHRSPSCPAQMSKRLADSSPDAAWSPWAWASTPAPCSALARARRAARGLPATPFSAASARVSQARPSRLARDKPEPVDGAGEPQDRHGIGPRLDAQPQRRPHVVVLPLQPLEPARLVGPQQPRLRCLDSARHQARWRARTASASPLPSALLAAYCRTVSSSR